MHANRNPKKQFGLSRGAAVLADAAATVIDAFQLRFSSVLVHDPIVVFDDVVIGSGLAALGVVLGLPPKRRVLVIGGPVAGKPLYYDATRTALCAHLAYGGLGTMWHGIISVGGPKPIEDAGDAQFEALLRYFYPEADVRGRVGLPWLFVPWRPIRPKAEWQRLSAERSGRLAFAQELASRFAAGRNGHVSVRTAESVYTAGRVWLCAGALHTPALLDRSLDAPVSRPFVSDHVLCYLGRIRSRTPVRRLRVQRCRRGVWFETSYDERGDALFTIRPARFSFRRLDVPIEHRLTAGVFTTGAIRKIVRDLSLGMMSEALYNHFGLLPNARVQSVYAQIDVPEAYRFETGDPHLTIHDDMIQERIDTVRTRLPWADIEPSNRPKIFIPATHLYHSVDVDEARRAGVNEPGSRVQVADASVLRDIGPDHHSFKVMVAAFRRAQVLTAC